MNTPKVGNADRLEVTISDRAATFLNINYVGRHRIKRIARALGISPGMAKKLVAGIGWTVARLDQASRLWPKFEASVWPKEQDFDDRLDRLLDEIAAVRDEINSLKTKLGGS
jgi:hypothetical protein